MAEDLHCMHSLTVMSGIHQDNAADLNLIEEQKPSAGSQVTLHSYKSAEGACACSQSAESPQATYL